MKECLYKLNDADELTSFVTKASDSSVLRVRAKQTLAFSKALIAGAICMGLLIGGADASANSSGEYSDKEVIANLDQDGYKIREEEESEFDNQTGSFVTDWREARVDHEDKDFGELIYNETSTPTKLEILRLLSKDTPSIMVFMHAISMGLGIDEVLQASVKYEPSKSRDLAGAAINLLPFVGEKKVYSYSGYELEDLERVEETQLYSVESVIKKFFDERLVLRPYPDWFEGQYHFLASATELKRLQKPQKNVRWYRTKSTESVTKRPIFVSLYEATETVLIDGEDRIREALKNDPNATLPVVFIFNRLNERPVDQLGYPETIRGVQAAYNERGLLVTPSPEWQLGEYHIYGKMDELYEIFNVPDEEDFEPEAWERLIAEAENYTVTNTAFLFVVTGDGDKKVDGESVSLLSNTFATWDNPRTESAFKYVSPADEHKTSLNDIMGKGLIFNRPDLIAALNALGVTKVPVAFYYIDSTRVKPFNRGPRALIQVAIGSVRPPGVGGGGGGFTPPPVDTPPGPPPVDNPPPPVDNPPPPVDNPPPASPPGIQ